ncbi:MAG: hypothetical protein EBZ07_08220 [Verrucomicrobia bacterium]|nr:hypothetical protein [Verrucomicrobiota bacterium]
MGASRLCLLAAFLGSLHAGFAESYEEHVARHKRVQKMMNPLNVPVANVWSDAWDENPEYANPKDKPAPKKGPAVFYIKSSRNGCGQLTYPFGKR